MTRYEVTGMSCAACVARVEKAVSQVQGVTECSVSLLTNSMIVNGNASSDVVIKAVTDAGYGAKVLSNSSNSNNAKKSDSDNQNQNKISTDEELLKDKESPILLKRFLYSLGFLLVLMYFSMGHSMWNFPVPSFFNENFIALGLLQLLLSEIIILINKKFFTSGISALFHGGANMDTLVALGSGISFVWSVVCLFAMTSAQLQGNVESVIKFYKNLYFESAAMILTLITIGKFLEAKSKGKTTNALKALLKLAPKTAIILRDEKEITVPIDELLLNDIFIVRPGEQIPVDGIVIEGFSAVNESALTGESLPQDKTIDSKVFSATMNQSGFLKCRATRVGQDTTINQIIQLVSDASATKAPIARIADKVSGIFVPTVIGIAAITFIVWLLCGAQIGFALARAISVLVISCPCALGLATPVAIMVANGKGASNGILFKTAQSLEITGKAKIIALDKTGTITKGEPSVTDIIPEAEISETELLSLAANLEAKSEHPLAKAILKCATQKGISVQPVLDFIAIAGKGVKATTSDGTMLAGGNSSFIFEDILKEKSLQKNSTDFSRQGKTPLYFSKDNKFLGTIYVADTIKEDSFEAIQILRKNGFSVVMLTGDTQLTAEEIGRQAGTDKVLAGILPQQKAQAIQSLQENGKNTVIMVGDGINDAPALTVADVGIAIGKGTDVAIEAADVVLVNGSLMDVASAVKLSKKTISNIKQNLFWAFFYNIIGIPLAAGCYISTFGWTLNPMFGAAAMSLSSFCVVTNALRLNFVKLYSKSKPKVKQIPDVSNISEKGATKMTQTIKIEGMMCSHCESHVKAELEKIDGVLEAVPSHQKANAILTLSKEVPEELLKNAVTNAGYKYLGKAE